MSTEKPPRSELLDDTSRCPVAYECESCNGTEGALLAVAAVETPVGVFCVTLCEACEDARRLPKMEAWSIAIERVGEHCGHVGVDVDQAAEMLEAERDDR